jgi:vacuolar-type H+-ATPase subunit I/STV1
MRRRVFKTAEQDRDGLEKMLVELRAGNLGELPPPEAHHVISALERRIEGLSAEMQRLR